MNADHRQFYSTEAAGYENKRYGSRYGRLFRAWHLEALSSALPATGAEKILDVATGTGQMLPELLNRGSVVVASDLTRAMLDVARDRFASSANLALCVSNAESLPFPDSSFAVVASSRFLHLFPSDRQALLIAQMARVVANGGTLIVDFYSANGRQIFSPFIRLYRKLMRKRPENDYRVRITEANAMIARAGLEVVSVEGIGNFLLLPMMFLPSAWLVKLGRVLGREFPQLSEQFLVVARKP